MTEPAKVVRRRILVALDATGHSLAALDAAAELATLLDADLSSIFVEDADLLRLAGLPFAREAGPGLPSRRVPGIASMERTLQRLAGQARAAAQNIPARHQVSCSFAVARGRVLTEVLAAAKGADIVAVGVRGRVTERHWRMGSTIKGILAAASSSVLMIRYGETLDTPVVVLYEGVPGSERALRAAAELAQRRDGRLLVLVFGPAEVLGELKKQAKAGLDPGLEATFRRFPEEQSRELVSFLSREGCGVLLLAHDSPLLARDGATFAQLRCPVLAIR
jgi:nucleotide-binding universal stress UspA family protein